MPSAIDVRFPVSLESPAVLVLPVCAGEIPAEFATAAASDGFTGELGTACDILAPSGRVLLAGIGNSGDTRDCEEAGAVAAVRLKAVPRVSADLRKLPPAQAAAFVMGACLRAWSLETYHTSPDDDFSRIRNLDLLVDDSTTQKAWVRQKAALAGALFARELATEPANILTPAGFIDRLRPLADHGIAIEVLDAACLAAAGFGALLAVGGGSAHPPCLAVLRWPGSLAQAPVALVGKGITFDTGGISIKPAEGMWEMKGDMAGAAACAGAILALALRKSPAPAIAVLAIAENATGSGSYRPGDIVHTLSGITVQVVDTDAEGRMVLADALTWAIRQNPLAVIDLATLTGSMVVALGHERAGLLGSDDALAEAVVLAGEAVGEPVWRMPIDESHRRALDSDIADIRQCVDARMQPDGSQAAAFLLEFVQAATTAVDRPVPWAHLDIAGVEQRGEASEARAKGATGFGARLLDRLIEDRFEGAPVG